MKKIKVYLQYPWKFPDSPYYKNLIQNSPKKLVYLNIKKQGGAITKKHFFKISNSLKLILRRFLDIFYSSLPNAHLSPPGEYDLIHCAHCISKNKTTPWVVDVEYPGQLWAVGHNIKNKTSVRKYLERNNCKKIVAWTELTKKSLEEQFPTIKEKLIKIYPLINFPNMKKRKHDGLNLLFVSRYFYAKGGLHAIETIDRLTNKYPGVKGIIVGDIPKEILFKYGSNKKIKFYELLPQTELFQKVYSISDIFVYPGYSDSFGFAIPEIMSLGIPVVSVDVSTRREIIEDGKNGLLVKTSMTQQQLEKLANKLNKNSKEIINQISKKIEELILDKSRLKELSKNARKIRDSSDFSSKETVKKWEEVYKDAVK